MCSPGPAARVGGVGGGSIVKRAPFVVAATAAGLAGVLSYHTKGTSLAALSAAPAPGRAPARSGSGGGGQASQPASSQPASSSHPPASSGQPATSHPTTPPTSAAPVGGTATGTLEQYGYGELSVRVTVSGGHISSIGTAELRTAESYSQQLAVQAIPMLRSEILKAQSTRVYGITGATYTSEAYAASVQSALDKLHFA